MSDTAERKMRFLYALRSKGVTDARVLTAMETVDRGAFVTGIFAAAGIAFVFLFKGRCFFLFGIHRASSFSFNRGSFWTTDVGFFFINFTAVSIAGVVQIRIVGARSRQWSGSSLSG